MTGPERETRTEATGERITVTGVRQTKGDGVNCPQILTDDGRTYSVKGLDASTAIGDRITVTGHMGNVMTCLGPVLIIEELTRL